MGDSIDEEEDYKQNENSSLNSPKCKKKQKLRELFEKEMSTADSWIDVAKKLRQERLLFLFELIEFNPRLLQVCLSVGIDMQIEEDLQTRLFRHALVNAHDAQVDLLLRTPQVRDGPLLRNIEILRGILEYVMEQRLGVVFSLLCRDASDQRAMVLCVFSKDVLDHYLRLNLNPQIVRSLQGQGARNIVQSISSLSEHPILTQHQILSNTSSANKIKTTLKGLMEVV